MESKGKEEAWVPPDFRNNIPYQRLSRCVSNSTKTQPEKQTNQQEPEPFINVGKVSELTALSEWTVLELARQGIIRSYQVGRRRLFRWSEVAEDIENGVKK